MNNAGKGEWRLVTAEGCEDGSLAAALEAFKEGDPRLRIETPSAGPLDATFDLDGVAVAVRGGSPIRALDLIEGTWKIWESAPQPLTRGEIVAGLRCIKRLLDTDPLHAASRAQLQELLGRPLPEFPRRIPFSERLPPDGEKVVFSSNAYGIRAGFLRRATKLGSDVMATSTGSVGVSTCTWWHPIAGPDAGDDE